MVAINNLTPVGFDFSESHFESALLAALAKQLVKYDTTVSLEQNLYSFAPIVLQDAILTADCAITANCDVPAVVKNTVIQMVQACTICLTNLSDAERQMYGIELADPKPTTILENRKALEQAVALSLSMLKTYWIGNTAMVAGDLTNTALLPAYKKDNGQWTKIAAIAGVPHFTIAKNALGTAALQLAITADESIDILDGLFAKQSFGLRMIPDNEKNGWITNEIYDAIYAAFSRKAITGIAFATVESEFGNFDSLVYRGAQFIKYNHLSAAIRDLKPTVADAWILPHRAVLTVGLPMVSMPIANGQAFNSQFYEAKKSYEAGTIATILQPEPVQADFYVVAY